MTTRTVRVGPSGQILKADLPNQYRNLKTRFSTTAEPPTREQSRFAKKDIKDPVAGPADTRIRYISFYEDGSEHPVHQEKVYLQWQPLPPASADPIPGEWPAPADAVPSTRSVTARLKMVDHNRNIHRFANTIRFTECPGNRAALDLMREIASDGLRCPLCDGAVRIDRKDAQCAQCGMPGSITATFENVPTFENVLGSNWGSLWNGGFAYQGTAWGDPESTRRALNRPESIPEYQEWKYVGKTPYDEQPADATDFDDLDTYFDPFDDDDATDDDGENSTSPEDFVRMAPGARACALDLLHASSTEDVAAIAVANHRILTKAAQEWGPSIEIRNMAYRSDPAFDDCPDYAMQEEELDEVAQILSSHLEKANVRDALTRGIRLARTYRGAGGTQPFGPSDESLTGWKQWSNLPPWARTMLRCATAITKALDPNGDIRARYAEYEIVDALTRCGDDSISPHWSDLIRQATTATEERFQRDIAANTALTGDDPFFLTTIVSRTAERRRSYREGLPVNARRILRTLDPRGEDKHLANRLGRPLTTQYPEQTPTMLLIEERLDQYQARLCGVSRRRRVAVVFHSVNRKGNIQRRRADGEPTGAHDVWISRLWWPMNDDAETQTNTLLPFQCEYCKNAAGRLTYLEGFSLCDACFLKAGYDGGTPGCTVCHTGPTAPAIRPKGMETWVCRACVNDKYPDC